ncbi:MAG: M14 family zinc carboxypeptidase [Bacteroidales bacterium]
MKNLYLSLLVILSCTAAYPQMPVDYYLPANGPYNSDITTPEEFLGYLPGEFHASHDQLVRYMETIAAESDRAVMQEYARSHELRPLVQLIFTAPQNIPRLEEMRKKHLANMDPTNTSKLSPEEVPLVIRLGYGVHGNESSASHAAMLTAYYLAAAESPQVRELLDNTVVLVDPCLNPDGFTRHTTWVNIHHSLVPSPDPASRQFREAWPGGRTNHYWFDLNRDYLLLVHPESRGRVEQFHRWKPNVVTDHHEMGAGSTFFFQPGVPGRNNPAAPAENEELTRMIAAYHARALDSIGSLYYSEEVFDDFYYGKGSSYPDVNGSVGILFEQAGFRGTWRETGFGLKPLAFAVRNQFAVTLSTLRAAHEMRNELIDHQYRFSREALNLARRDPIKARIVGDPYNPTRTARFIDLLLRHQIRVYHLKEEVRAGKQMFTPGHAYVVPTEQEQYRMINGLFETITEFSDTTFYDISTWTMPLAFNMPVAELRTTRDLNRYLGEQVTGLDLPRGKVEGGKSRYGYLFTWDDDRAPRALYILQEAGLRARVATAPFRYRDQQTDREFGYGSIMVHTQDQPLDIDEIYTLVTRVARETGVDFLSLRTGLTPQGIDMGSSSFRLLKKPSVMMLAGTGIRSQQAGEIWFHFDHRDQIPVTLVDISQAGQTGLNRYNTIILPEGSYRNADNGFAENLAGWIRNGGTLIAFGQAGRWLAEQKMTGMKYKSPPAGDTTRQYTYSERSRSYTLNNIPGSILQARADLSHPLLYGYRRPLLPVFKEGATVAVPGPVPWAEPLHFCDDPLMSGYVSEENLTRLAESPVVSLRKLGKGNIMVFHENILFRGIWQGTARLLSNAVFFGNIISL